MLDVYFPLEHAVELLLVEEFGELAQNLFVLSHRLGHGLLHST